MSRFSLVAGAALTGAVMLAYSNTFFAPLVYDDVPAILENETIRNLGSALVPPPGVTTSGRPLLNLSLAFNYAISGYRVWSYHVVNVAIHVGAALLLFGTVRRTLLLPSMATRWGEVAGPVALLAAALWALHPMNTESVTYVVQRAESLMGLCYFATVYGFVRSEGLGGGVGWRIFSTVACLLGMLSKEVMVSAPVLVFFYDRTFVAGTFRGAWSRRKNYHGALLLTWIPLAWVVASGGGNRGGTVGFGTVLGWWGYGLTQFEAVARYVGLAFWPHPLVFEYGPFYVARSGEVIPFAVIVVPLVVGTFVALWRWPVAGFLGAWFFAMLAPTSLVPGTTQMIVEHRMYLSLAAIMVGVAWAMYAWWGRGGLVAGGVVALGLGALTFARNSDYRSAVSLWASVVDARPANALAHCNLANALVGEGRVGEALPHYETAVRISPGLPTSHFDFAVALTRAGRTADAVAEYERAVAIKPDFWQAHAEAGQLRFEQQRVAEAMAHFEAALRVNPRDAETQGALANALFVSERTEEALARYKEALRLAPDDPEIHYNFGNSLLRLGRPAEAVREYEAALRVRADFADAHYNAGVGLARLGRTAEAMPHFEAALRQRPDFSAAREALERLRGGR